MIKVLEKGRSISKNTMPLMLQKERSLKCTIPRLGRITPQFLPIMLFVDSSMFTYYAYQYVPIILNIMLKITIFLTMIIVLQKN